MVIGLIETIRSWTPVIEVASIVVIVVSVIVIIKVVPVVVELVGLPAVSLVYVLK